MGGHGNGIKRTPNGVDDPATNNAIPLQSSKHNNNNDDAGIANDDLIVDPLLQYLDINNLNNLNAAAAAAAAAVSSSQHNTTNANKKNTSFNIPTAIQALQTTGYYHLPSVLNDEECNESLNQLWDFVEDVSGGCVSRDDPYSWYPSHETTTFVCNRKNNKDQVVVVEQQKMHGKAIPIIGGSVRSSQGDDDDCGDNGGDDGGDLDPWPHTENNNGMLQSLGAGYVLGGVRERLAKQIFEPLFGTRELLCSKEGFTFDRPAVVDLAKENVVDVDEEDAESGDVLLWKPHPLKSSTITGDSRSNTPSNGGGDSGDVDIPIVSPLSNNNYNNNNGISKKQRKRNQKKTNKQQRYKDVVGLCHIRALISFTDQTVDRHSGGGYFSCRPHYLHSSSSSSFGKKGTGDSDNAENNAKELDEKMMMMGRQCPEKRIYAGRGDVILWRSDLIHAGIMAPSSMSTAAKKSRNNGEGDDHDYDHDGATHQVGSREFCAVGYCSMLPVQAAKNYALYSIPKQKLTKSIKGKKMTNGSRALPVDMERANRMLRAKEEELIQRKLESYKTGRTGDHRPDVEEWHSHRRVTMWNTSVDHGGGDEPHRHRRDGRSSGQESRPAIPPRMLQRPRFRLGAPALTERQAELYGLLPYRERGTTNDDDVSRDEEIMQQKAIERAVIRGVRFVEGVYKERQINGEDVGPWTIKDGKFCADGENAAIEKYVRHRPICLAKMEVLTPRSDNGASVGLSGQDKYLGGMASPCGRYIYGVPGHAKRVVRVDVRSGEVDFIGPEYVGEFKWLRGVEIPGHTMGTNDDGSLVYPSGCCLALPCNSQDGCVLKIDPETSRVSTFLTGSIPNVEEGWLYHGGNLVSDGFVYAIPASAPRVMKIDARAETTEFIGPAYPGKAKWYGGITGIDGCIYGLPHNATGVLKIDPRTQEVTILAEGTLPEGLWKWHGGLASMDGSKIIGFPNNADSVLVIDVIKQRVYTVGDSSILRSGYHRVPQDGRYKYLGGSLTADGKLAYLFPCDAEYVLRFDMETDELKLVGPQLTEGENKFQNGFVGGDGCIYGIPQRSSGVLRIIPRGVRRYGRDGVALPAEEEYVDMIYCGDDMVSCKDKFEGGVLGFDGNIYCIPLRAKAFVNIIPGPSIET